MRLTRQYHKGITARLDEVNLTDDIQMDGVVVIDLDTGIAYTGDLWGGTEDLRAEVKEAIMDGTLETRHAAGARLRYVGPYEENKGRTLTVEKIDDSPYRSSPVTGRWDDTGGQCWLVHGFLKTDGVTPCFEPVE